MKKKIYLHKGWNMEKDQLPDGVLSDSELLNIIMNDVEDLAKTTDDLHSVVTKSD